MLPICFYAALHGAYRLPSVRRDAWRLSITWGKAQVRRHQGVCVIASSLADRRELLCRPQLGPWIVSMRAAGHRRPHLYLGKHSHFVGLLSCHPWPAPPHTSESTYHLTAVARADSRSEINTNRVWCRGFGGNSGLNTARVHVAVHERLPIVRLISLPRSLQTHEQQEVRSLRSPAPILVSSLFPLRLPISTVKAGSPCVWRCCPNWPRYQRGAAQQKNARLIDHGPLPDPRGRPKCRVPRFESAFSALICVCHQDTQPNAAARQEQSHV